MQPHTGASLCVINYLKPTAIADPEKIKPMAFDVRTTMPHKIKLHQIRVTHYNPGSQILSIEAGKDFTCYMKVRFRNAIWDELDFIEHRHTYIREHFRMLGESISGDYLGESSLKHEIQGKVVSPKQVSLYDYITSEKNPVRQRTFTYNCRIENIYYLT